MSASERDTRQKRAVWDVLSQAMGPLSEPEIRKAAQHLVPGIGRATIFRALRRLLSEKRVVPVELPGQVSRYEIGGKGHHHHFLCHHCGRVFELFGCVPAVARLAPPQFQVDAHEIILYGRCRDCFAHAPVVSPDAASCCEMCKSSSA